MLRVTLFVFLFAFIIFRPFQAQKPGMMYGGDDTEYFAFATSLVYFQYPSFEKEYLDSYQVSPLSRVGPAIMAAPFVGAFSLVDRAFHAPIVKKRTSDNVIQSWTLFGMVFAAAFYLWLACYFCYRALLAFVKPKYAWLAVFLMILAQGTPLYAYRRPAFSHIYELVLQSAFLLVLIISQTKPDSTKWIKLPRLYGVLGGLSLLTLLVRQNGIFYAILWPSLILGLDQWRLKKREWKKVAVLLLVTFLAYFVIKNIPYWYAKEKYEEVNKVFETSGFMFKFERPWFYLKRLYTIFIGADWGLVYTAPYILVGIGALKLARFPTSKVKNVFIGLALPLLMNLYILIIWKGQGSWYGYRYLVFSAAPVLIIPFALLLQQFHTKRVWVYRALVAWSVLPLVSQLLYEATPTTYLNIVITEFGERNWGNLNYQIEVWKIALLRPGYFIYSVIKSGPAYLAYVAANLVGVGERLPLKFRDVYASFDPQLVIKTFLLYLMPWGLYALLSRSDRAKAIK